MEEILLEGLDLNFLPKYVKADMPYSDKHRVKVRLWQFLIVAL